MTSAVKVLRPRAVFLKDQVNHKMPYLSTTPARHVNHEPF